MSIRHRAAVVLIVEDEPLVRMTALDIAEDAGFRVIEANDAEEAVSLLEQNPEISVIFTDIEMPGDMNGLKLAACVRDRWPPVRIIVTSGRVLPELSDLPMGATFLAKPYRPDELARELNAIPA